MSDTQPADATADRSNTTIIMGVVVCFILSGFAALIYQTAWMRQFSLVFGTSELAVAAVLSAYMGGLALGAGIAARYVHKVRRPIFFYGVLEAGIAISALAVPLLLMLSRSLYIAVFGDQPDPVDASGLGQSLFYLGTAFVVLAIPTSFMGATLPLLTKYVVRNEDQIGPRVGLLYATNTLGAVAGTVVAGFLLLPALGLRGTVFVGVAVNLLVFVIAALIAKRVAVLSLSSPNKPSRTEVSDAENSGSTQFNGRGWILPVMLLSGLNSFVYEVLWTRLLGHILGGSITAFATMLASFLGGIAIGSAIAARFAKTRTAAINGFIIAQCSIAFASIAIYELLPLAIPESAGLKGNVPLAIMILMPATLFIGATFPLAVRIFAKDADSAASASASVYSWNTVGAIAGATLAAFLLIPALKYEGTIRFAVIVNIALALTAAMLIGRRRVIPVVATALLLVAAGLLYQPAMPEDILRTSPVTEARSGEIRYYEVGRSATVLVLEDDGYLNLRTNGLPEASTNLKGAPPYKHNQRLLSALPVLARPGTESMLIVGFGAGATLEGVPPSVRSIDVVELEPKVIDANRSISDERQIDPLADPRVRVFINDARSALALTSKRYDAIVSQPSHPWTAGASHLYTREFMQLAGDHLTEDGVYLQWMNSQFVDEALLKSLCATMLDVFEHVRVYQWDPQILFFLGSAKPLDVEAEMARTGRPLSDDRIHYREKGVGSVEDAVVALTMEHRNVVAFAGDAPVISDNDNLMATRSSAAIDNDETLTLNRLVDAVWDYDPLQQPDSSIHSDFPTRLNFTYISRRLEGLMLKRRAIALANTLFRMRNPESLVIIGLGQDRQAQMQESQRNLLLAIESDPGSDQARYALLKPRLIRIAQGEEQPQRIRDALEQIRGTAAITVSAWLAATRNDWDHVTSLDAGLAAVQPTDLWYLDAVKLRVDWRIKDQSPGAQPERAREARRLIDDAIALFQDPDFYAMRLAASFVADDTPEIIETARRLVYIFNYEADLSESGELEPDIREVQNKLRQVEAVRVVLANLQDDERVPQYKLDLLEASIELLSDRFVAIGESRLQ